MHLPQPDELFAERYRIVRMLGEGGFANVYLADDHSVGRAVAVKVLRPGRGGYERRRKQRFLREAKTIANLSHPSTVTMFEFGQSDNGLLFAVFEYVPGEDLDQLVERRGPLPEADALHILIQVSNSLGEAHDAGVLHRDIKPENIRIFEMDDDPLRAKVLDFGIAKRLDGDDVRLTGTGNVVGTPRYMSPEQLRGEPLSPASDIYSLGLVAYDLLLGMKAGWIQAMKGPAELQLTRADGVSEPVRHVVNRMLRGEPRERFGSIESLRAALVEARSRLAPLYRNDARGEETIPTVPSVASGQKPTEPSLSLPEPGQTFEGRYQLNGVLGEGGFARVFRAHDLRLHRDVALKVLAPRSDKYKDTSARRFMREAKLVARLQDPHTITMFDHGVSDEGLLFMACEFVDGADLASVLRQKGPLRPSVVVHILYQVLSSLREAHRAGVFHRDLKPANILVHRYGSDEYAIKVLDFGLAKTTDPDATKITREGMTTGTPRFMSPEQILGEAVGPPSDIYSLGLVAFEMLTHRPAVDGANVKEILRAHVNGPAIRLPQDVAPPALRNVIERMCERDLASRYGDVEQILRDLRPMLSSRSATAPAVSDASSNGPTSDQRKRLRRVGFAIAIVAIGVAGVIAAAIRNTEPDRQINLPPEPRNVAALTSPPSPRRTEAAPDANQDPVITMDVGTNVDAPSIETGCGKPETRTELPPTIEHHYDGGDFAYYLPKPYDPDHRHPVVIMLHKLGSSGIGVMNDAEIHSVADEHGFIVLAPRDRNMRVPWQTAPASIVFSAFDELDQIACVDRSRVFVLGEAAGGDAAVRLGCVLPLAGVATVNFRADGGCPEGLDVLIARGTLSENAGDGMRPAPYIHFTGLRDPSYPVSGGLACDGRKLPSLQQHESAFLEAHQCGERRRRAQVGRSHCWTWDCEVPFVSCHLPEGGSFRNSGGRTLSFLCPDARSDVDIASVAWSFFESLPPDPQRRIELQP